jgi:hypothetical protein
MTQKKSFETWVSDVQWTDQPSSNEFENVNIARWQPYHETVPLDHSAKDCKGKGWEARE